MPRKSSARSPPVAAGEAAVRGESLVRMRRLRHFSASGRRFAASRLFSERSSGTPRHAVARSRSRDSPTSRSAYPGSRNRMNHAFSAKRQASRKKGTL